MSIKPPRYGPRGLELQLLNSIFQNHDLCCGCDDPLYHILSIINTHNKANLSDTKLKEIKCLLTGEDTDKEDHADGTAGVLDAIDDGDLDALFEVSDDMDAPTG